MEKGSGDNFLNFVKGNSEKGQEKVFKNRVINQNFVGELDEGICLGGQHEIVHSEGSIKCSSLLEVTLLHKYFE